MVNTEGRDIDAILMEALSTFESALIVYLDNEYPDEDDATGVAHEIALRGTMYTSLNILREVAEEAADRVRADKTRSDVWRKRVLEAEKKLAQIRNATK